MEITVHPNEPVNNYLKLKALQEERTRLSDYNQLLVLECVEFFRATPIDVVASGNKHVVGQIGLRCRFCGPRRNPSSIAFPGKIALISPNICAMASHHMINRHHRQVSRACPCITQNMRELLDQLSKESLKQTKERGGTDLQVRRLGHFRWSVDNRNCC